ncbi:MAG: squalene--hopene cyclase [Verrucomicrobiota bacterium]
MRETISNSSRVPGVIAVLALSATIASAQGSSDLRFGGKVPPDVRTIYERGLAYLIQNQTDDGDWPGQSDGIGTRENGITALGLMALLAGGEDPNHGRYRLQVKRALRHLIASQDPETGFFANSMYHHGFSMLALAEAYGAVDDDLLWQNVEVSGRVRSIGEALELSVRCALTSQDDNPYGAWRYSPTARDADTSVAGAVTLGLLAARNAGIEVPDRNIDTAFDYFRTMTMDSGFVRYSGPGGTSGDSLARSSIVALVLAIGKRKDWESYAAAAGFLQDNIDAPISGEYPLYTRYYMAQALFQADYEAWQIWNGNTVRTLKSLQSDDGSFASKYGSAYGTAMSLLAIALNYRLLPIYER